MLIALLLPVSLVSLGRLLVLEGSEAGIDLDAIIPKRVGEWMGTDEEVTEGTKRLLGAKNVLIRNYARPGRPGVLLCITFSAGSHRTTHPAGVCYEGQGWNILVDESLDFEFKGETAVYKTVNHLEVNKGERTLDVIVWYRTNSQDTASYLRQKIDMLFCGLFGGHRWSAMIRLSAIGDGRNPAAALEAIADFGGTLLPYLGRLRHEEAGGGE